MAPKIIDHSVTLKTKTGSVDGGRKFWRKWNKFGIGALRPPGGHLSKGTSALWVPTVQYSILEFYRSVFFSLQWLEGHSCTCFPSGYWLMATTHLEEAAQNRDNFSAHCVKRNTLAQPTLHWRCALVHRPPGYPLHPEVICPRKPPRFFCIHGKLFSSSSLSSIFLDPLISLGSMLETESLSDVVEILSNLGHISGISSAYLRPNLGISWAYLWHVLGIPLAYFVHTLGIPWAHLGISLGHIWYILGTYWGYLGHIIGISWAYFGHILGRSWAYLGDIFDVMLVTSKSDQCLYVCHFQKELPSAWTIYDVLSWC